MVVRTGWLATKIGGLLHGNAEKEVEGVASLEEATDRQVSFLSNKRYDRLLLSTNAGVVLVSMEQEVPPGMLVIRVTDPYASFALVLQLFNPPQQWSPHIDDKAHISDTAKVDESCSIEGFVWVAPHAVIGARTRIESHVRIGIGAVVGEDCILMAGSVVCDGCQVGDRVVLQPGAVIGADGFGFAPTEKGNRKIPQQGKAIVDDDVEIGANSCVDRGTLGDTRIERGVKTDNLVQVGHGATIGEHSLMVAYSGVAGSSRLGMNSVLAARATVLGHLELGNEITVGAASVVTKSLPGKMRVTGYPAIPHGQWLRQNASQRKIQDLRTKIEKLESRLENLELRLDEDL